MSAADGTVLRDGTDMAEGEARAFVAHVRASVADIAELIVRAVRGRAWIALGYASWDAMCEAEFDGAIIRLPREDRREAVASLREAGLSTRAIAGALGVGKSTIDRDVDSTVPNGTVDRVTSLDGRDRPASRSPSSGSNGGSLWDQVDDICEDPKPADPADYLSAAELALWQRLQQGETVVVSYRCHAELIELAEEHGLFVRIDRRTDWGNPFEIPDDGDRAAVIAKYAAHYLPYKPVLLRRLPELRGRALACWCAPEACHGDVLKAGAET